MSSQSQFKITVSIVLLTLNLHTVCIHQAVQEISFQIFNNWYMKRSWIVISNMRIVCTEVPSKEFLTIVRVLSAWIEKGVKYANSFFQRAFRTSTNKYYISLLPGTLFICSIPSFGVKYLNNKSRILSQA